MVRKRAITDLDHCPENEQKPRKITRKVSKVSIVATQKTPAQQK
jgi:hypothetical protein